MDTANVGHITEAISQMTLVRVADKDATWSVHIFITSRVFTVATRKFCFTLPWIRIMKCHLRRGN